MTTLADTEEFREKLRASIAKFRMQEDRLRRQYAQAKTLPPKDMLERTTRRFLVDELLRALDWNPDDATQVAEEARAHSKADSRLYFDYLGIAPRTETPVLLFEAKGFDIEPPRKARGLDLSAQEMAVVVAKAVDALKKRDTSIPIISTWAEFLRDMQGYIVALDPLGKKTLRRAAITAGQWIIIFREPVETFHEPGPANTDHIVCFTSFDDIQMRHADIYSMLHRSRLVDTLPATLSLPEALKMLPVKRIEKCFRAVLVATKSSGAFRKPYPTRSIYPALIVRSGALLFTIVNYDRAVEEPLRTDDFTRFLTELESVSRQFEARVASRWGLTLQPSRLEDFPGFVLPNISQQGIAPAVIGSTAHMAPPPPQRTFVTTAEALTSEYIVVTGSHWFYKSVGPFGPECEFHFWKSARDKGVSAPEPHSGYVSNSFTEDGISRHCANDDLSQMRTSRCHIRPIETHLCCRGCVFSFECWQFDSALLPCP